MYPKIFADYFRPFDRANEVFVAMPFAREFGARWKSIFQPAIRTYGLMPYRVDTRAVSDSILTDILAGIARARFVLVDISSETSAARAAVPNANVMYELGLAHAMRLPEEVIVVRAKSRGYEAPFDIRHIRWAEIDPMRPEASQRRIRALFKAADKAIDVARDILVDRAVRALDPDMVRFLYTIREDEQFDLSPFDPDRKGLYGLGMRDVREPALRRIARSLIARGILEAGDPGDPKQRVYGGVAEYKLTPLGRAVAERLPAWPRLEADATRSSGKRRREAGRTTAGPRKRPT